MSTAPALAVQDNPFPGLRPFREDEEYVFFGRESQVDAMVNQLVASRFLAVVGTSGSGKSSLVNCGLRPALHGGLMAQAGTAWRMAQFRPGSDPLRAMTRALAKDGVLFRDFQAAGLPLAEIVDTTLRMSTLGLIDIYEQAQLGEDVNLLLVVDQFEELFRYRQLGASQQDNVYGVSEDATAFVDLLLEAKAQTTYPIYVVLTMRSDFLGDCAQLPGLAEAINAGQYLLPRLTRDERRAAISGPIGVGGAEIAPVLLTRLVNDVGDNPDQLSILQHALNRTWARWQNEGGASGPLDLAHYESIGTMAHALDQHAEQAYAELDTRRQRHLCKKLFKALTDKATDPRGVRRPTTLGTLCALTDASPAEVTQVIDVFRQPSRSFLMPPAGEALESGTVIDISHESLMRVWQPLNQWAEREAISAENYRRLEQTARLWHTDQAALWGTPDLENALAWSEQESPSASWAERYGTDFGLAMEFLDASAAQREAERQDEKEARQRELDDARKLADEQHERADAERQRAEEQARAAKRLGRLSAVLAVVVVLAMATGLFAWRQWQHAQSASVTAQEQQKEAEEARLAEQIARLAAEEARTAEQTARLAAEEAGTAAQTARLAAEEARKKMQSAFLDVEEALSDAQQQRVQLAETKKARREAEKEQRRIAATFDESRRAAQIAERKAEASLRAAQMAERKAKEELRKAKAAAAEARQTKVEAEGADAKPRVVLSKEEAQKWLEDFRLAWQEKKVSELVKLGEVRPQDAQKVKNQLDRYGSFHVSFEDTKVSIEGNKATISFIRMDKIDGEDFPIPGRQVLVIEKQADGDISRLN